jgi:capsule polysaccharide export protein KpsE/RkpR
MSYKVIRYFVDLQDSNHSYEVGDSFPRLGLNVSNKRLEELAGSNNKQGRPLIEKVSESKKEDFSQYMNEPEESTEVAYTKTEINRMPTADLRKLAKENGLDDSLSGAEIKKSLIAKFEL